jgi:CheY-like chemotaxis protein
MNNAHSTATPSRTAGSSLGSTRKDQSGIKCAKRILVVDDNIVFLKAMSLKIRAFGYDVVTAVDGASAVSTVRKLKPDLILLDLNFPPDVAHGGGVSWDGLLILSWLRRMHEAERIPVIAITAGDAARYKEQCMAAGVVDLFIKPVDHEVRNQKLRKKSQRRTRRRSKEFYSSMTKRTGVTWGRFISLNAAMKFSPPKMPQPRCGKPPRSSRMSSCWT